jgi:hypothetical protein
VDDNPRWRVQMLRTATGEYEVTVVLDGVATMLPALEAHKLGSALRIASGLEDLEPLPPL